MSSQQEAESGELQKESSLNLLDLSTFLLMNILARLSVCSINNCRHVCKFFRNLISEKYFEILFLDLRRHTSIIYDSDVGLHWLNVANSYCKCYRLTFPGSNIRIVDSCNGLFCLMEFVTQVFSLSFYNIYICQPTLEECIRIPKPNPRDMHLEVYGFGFSGSTGEYKILRISCPMYPSDAIYKKKSDVQIFSIGTTTWRDVGNAPYPSSGKLCGATANGALHWLFTDMKAKATNLYGFDMYKEQAKELPLPPIDEGTYNLSIGVLWDDLCLFDGSDPTRFSIWSMKEYGVRESWMILEHIDLNATIPAGLNAAKLRFVAILKDDTICIKLRSGNFYSYDHINKNLIKIKADDIELLTRFDNHVVHIPNFRSLNTLETGGLTIKRIMESG